MSVEEKDDLTSEAEKVLEAAEELKKKKQEEIQKKLEQELGNRFVVSLGQSASTNPQMMNLLNKIDPKLTLESLQNGLKNWDGKEMANHPLMQNKMVQHFAKTFANEMLKVDQKMGGKLSKGDLGAGVQQGMEQLQQFANSLPAAAPAQGAAAKFSKMLGNLSPTKAIVGSLARTAASFVYQGAKMAHKYSQSQQAASAQQVGATATSSDPTNASPQKSLKTAGKMAGMLSQLSGGKEGTAGAAVNAATSAVSSAVSGGPSKLAKLLKNSFLKGLK